MMTNFKPARVMDKVKRHRRRMDTKAAEALIMKRVRQEDKYCRFPQCGCGKLKLVLDVAHAGEQGHRKMGGNRSLSSTVPENLILLCRPRHRAHRFAVDKGSLRVEALTERGLRGPVRWWVELSYLPIAFADQFHLRLSDGELMLAEETAPHVFLPFTPDQDAILKLLSGMEC